MPIVSVSRLDAVVLRVRNLDRAIDWYANTLGLTPAHRDDATGIAILQLDGAPLTLWRIPDAAPDGGDGNDTGEATGVEGVRGEPPLSAHVAAFPIFAVQDAEAAHAALQQAGVRVSPLREDLSVRWCEFTDPDGNRLEVCESAM